MDTTADATANRLDVSLAHRLRRIGILQGALVRLGSTEVPYTTSTQGLPS